MLVELMGNKAGWLTLYAGIAGGADIILIPERPYTIEKVCAAIENRAKQGKHFSLSLIHIWGRPGPGRSSSRTASPGRRGWERRYPPPPRKR